VLCNVCRNLTVTLCDMLTSLLVAFAYINSARTKSKRAHFDNVICHKLNLSYVGLRQA
jgi:hypothetical protein